MAPNGGPRGVVRVPRGHPHTRADYSGFDEVEDGEPRVGLRAEAFAIEQLALEPARVEYSTPTQRVSQEPV